MGDLYTAISTLNGTFSAAKGAGIPEEAWERFRSDEAFRQRTARFWESGAFTDPFDEDSPQDLYGQGVKVFGPDEWETFFRVKLTPKQTRVAEAFPWSNVNDHLGAFGESHFFFLGLDTVRQNTAGTGVPLDISMLGELADDWAYWQGRPRLGKTTWMTEPDMPACTPSARWYCMSLESSDSVDTSIDDENYEVPNTAEYLLAHLLFYQKYGTYMTLLYRDVICSDVTSGNWQRLALRLDPETKKLLVVDTTGDRAGTQGFALSRKLPT